jgi:hypothetical protein
MYTKIFAFLSASTLLLTMLPEVHAQTEGAAAVNTGEGGGNLLFGLRNSSNDKSSYSLLLNMGNSSSKIKANNFGKSLLAPTLRDQGFQLYFSGLGSQNLQKAKPNADAKPKNKSKFPIGAFYVRLGGSFVDFEGDVPVATKQTESTPTTELKTFSGQLLSGTLGWQWLLQDQQNDSEDEKTKFSAGVSLGLTGRMLMGDVASKSNDDFRLKALGTTQKQFWSPEITLYANMGDIQPYIQYTNFGGKGIAGLADHRLIIGARAMTNFFSPPTVAEDPAPPSPKESAAAKALAKDKDAKAFDAANKGTRVSSAESTFKTLGNDAPDGAFDYVKIEDPETNNYFVVSLEKVNKSQEETKWVRYTLDNAKTIEKLLQGQTLYIRSTDKKDVYKVKRLYLEDTNPKEKKTKRNIQKSQILF